MSGSLINFESAREKEQQRQWEREARKAVLEKAKDEYEAKQQREEEARRRGEHTWMLPSVEARLAQDPDKKKKKKKDKKKKKKKEKKAKKRKRKDSSSSDSESGDEDGDEAVWVESSSSVSQVPPTTTTTTNQPPVQGGSAGEAVKRDGWMEMTSLFGTFSRDEMREREGTSRKKAKEEEEKRKREADKPGSHARELNPYYKNGGTGLPEEEGRSKEHPPAPQSTGLDAAWLRRALQRAQEQAEAEKRPLEEIAANRWGSLARFKELLAEAEGRGNRKEESLRGQNSRTERSSGNSREKMASRSADWEPGRHRRDNRSRSRERGKRDDGDRGHKSRRSKDRSLSRERRGRSEERKRRHHRRHSSSSSSSSSNNSRGSRCKNKQVDRRDVHQSDEKQRISPKLFKRPDDTPQTSTLSSKFVKPEDDTNMPSGRRTKGGGGAGGGGGGDKRWQKKDFKEAAAREQHRKRSPSPSSSSESSSAEEEEKETPVPLQSTTAEREAAPPQVTSHPLTDKEMNDLAAKIVKAELVGNDTQANKLRAKLEAARAARAAGAGAASGGQEGDATSSEQLVVLTRLDSRGVSRPVMGAGAEVGPGTKKKKVKTHGKDGQRARYFPDDDQHDLKYMFEKEKGTTAEDQNTMFEDAAMKNSERLNDDYDIDDMFMSKAAMRDSAAKQAERDKQKAIQEHRRAERSLEACQWCFDSKEMPKHLIVALGTKCYLSLPAHQSLTPGHCCITPIHHITSCVQADEDLWGEVQSFRKSLVRMFASRGEDCIFFETVKRLRYFPHMVLQCIPLPRETGDMAPIYFKKAILECEKEWAQNKKLVELKGRDVRRAVPKGLPYFFVDFAMEAGFAHVIEDEQDFPNNFAQEIVGGMLDLDNNLWRKPRRENFDAQRRKVMEFSRWYKDFDPTQE